MKTDKEIKDQIITINYYLLEGIRKGDKKSVQKNKILLDNILKLYLKEKNG